MTPDELDAAVAEKVFGYAVERWTQREKGMHGIPDHNCQVWITDPARKNELAQTRQDITINPIPFSSSWSAMQLVVERLATLFDVVSFDLTPDTQWNCHIARKLGPDDWQHWDGLAADAPRAVCLAACAAMEVHAQ